MDVYPWVVLVHVISVILFFVAHGTSMAVAFRLRRERDPARVRALLDLSSWTLGVPAIIAVLIGLLTGILAGFLGGWWGAGWIWTSLVIFVVVGGLMTPLVAARLNRMRAAAGTVAQPAFAARKGAEVPAGDPAELDRLLDEWNPIPAAAMGFGALLVILWLMLLKPF
jgi:uncharacterized membrane protein